MIYNYSLEIKYRIFFSFIAWIFILINCYYFKETLLYIFMGFSFKLNNNNLLYFLTTDVAEVFIAYIHLSFHIANQITLIFICCQFIFFVSTGLYIFEYIYITTVTSVSVVGWITLIFVLNTFIFPISWDFFLKFQNYLSSKNLVIYFEVKLSEYLLFYKSLYYLCNLIYQVIIFFFIILDLFKTNLLIIKKLRKIFYFIFIFISTLLTPPEIVYQILVSVSIIIIYELLTIHMIFKTELAHFT